MGRLRKVCFVCLGNICRSPAAEAVMRQLVEEAGLADAIEVDSAGTSRYHLGDQPDPRARTEAARRGIAMDHRARQLMADELGRWDLVLGMDAANVRDVRAMVRGRTDVGRIDLLRSFDVAADPTGPLDVPDPYYGEDTGFSAMFDLIEPACRGLLAVMSSDDCVGRQ